MSFENSIIGIGLLAGGGYLVYNNYFNSSNNKQIPSKTEGSKSDLKKQIAKTSISTTGLNANQIKYIKTFDNSKTNTNVDTIQSNTTKTIKKKNQPAVVHHSHHAVTTITTNKKNIKKVESNQGMKEFLGTNTRIIYQDNSGNVIGGTDNIGRQSLTKKAAKFYYDNRKNPLNVILGGENLL